MTHNRRLYLDLDGVLADFDAHFEYSFGVHPRTADGAGVLWDNINSYPTFFADLPMFEDTLWFFRRVQSLNPKIITACPKTNYHDVAFQKRQWVYKNLGDFEVLPVMGGKNKVLFMHSPGDVLVDDFEKNLKPWTKHGGVSIHHSSLEDSLNKLETYFDIQIQPQPSIPFKVL
nr:MAG TPA: 5'(3')-deoxyribonucleotidase [Caudoviricetes sp.]